MNISKTVKKIANVEKIPSVVPKLLRFWPRCMLHLLKKGARNCYYEVQFIVRSSYFAPSHCPPAWCRPRGAPPPPSPLTSSQLRLLGPPSCHSVDEVDALESGTEARLWYDERLLCLRALGVWREVEEEICLDVSREDSSGWRAA